MSLDERVLAERIAAIVNTKMSALVRDIEQTFNSF